MRAKKKLLPVEINLSECVLLEDSAMFITPRTLDELEWFQEEHNGQFELACEGKGATSGQSFLREYEWAFGTSKSEVLRTVMRRGRSGKDEAEHLAECARYAPGTDPAVIGDDHVVPANRVREVVLHHDKIAACPPDEALTIEVRELF